MNWREERRERKLRKKAKRMAASPNNGKDGHPKLNELECQIMIEAKQRKVRPCTLDEPLRFMAFQRLLANGIVTGMMRIIMTDFELDVATRARAGETDFTDEEMVVVNKIVAFDAGVNQPNSQSVN